MESGRCIGEFLKMAGDGPPSWRSPLTLVGVAVGAAAESLDDDGHDLMMEEMDGRLYGDCATAGVSFVVSESGIIRTVQLRGQEQPGPVAVALACVPAL